MKLFEKGRIGSMVTKNRIAMCPMGVGRMADVDGGFSRRLIDYYAARARGGVGLIITGSSLVTTALEPGLGILVSTRVDGFGQLSRLNELCDAIHHHGAKIAIQLVPGMGRVNFPDVQPVSASAVPCFADPSIICRELTIAEIQTLVRAYATAAAIVQAAGADAIEIHGYGGYLLDQFQTSLWNKRTDQYGGDLDGRMRLSMEIIGATRAAVGPDFPLIYKFTPAHYIEGGRDLDEGLDMARRLEKAGVDALHVDLGCYECWYKQMPCMYEPPASQVHLSQAVKEVVKLPVIAHGKLGYPDVAESVLQEGKSDFVALGRPLLADPDWALKVKQGRPEDIIPCIGDLEGCLGRTHALKYLSCTVNPITGMEREYALTPAEKRKSVLVIGGGPGGMEAARVAALRGHEVALWEKCTELGGNMLPASAPDFKADVRRLIDYLSTQVKKLGVKVELNKEATADLVLQLKLDVVILAAGASPLIPEAPGMKGANVSTAPDVLLGKKEIGQRVLVAGGGVVGCETAVYLAKQGKKVTVVEMMEDLLPETMNPISKMALMAMVAESGVEALTSTTLVEATADGASVETGGSRREFKADSVVLALGFKANQSLQNGLEGKGPELYAIGDCVEPGKILNAIWQGFHASRLI